MRSLCRLPRAICRVRVVYYRAELPGRWGVVPPSPLKPDCIKRTHTGAGRNKVKGQRSDTVAKRCLGVEKVGVGGGDYLLLTDGVVLSTSRLLDLLTLSEQRE